MPIILALLVYYFREHVQLAVPQYGVASDSQDYEKEFSGNTVEIYGRRELGTGHYALRNLDTLLCYNVHVLFDTNGVTRSSQKSSGADLSPRMTTISEDTPTFGSRFIIGSVESVCRGRGGSLSLKGRPQTPTKIISEKSCFEPLVDRSPTPSADVEELEWFDVPAKGYRLYDESSLSVSERKWLVSEDFARAMRFTSPQHTSRGLDMVVDAVMQYVEEQRKCKFGYFQEAKGFQITPTTNATECDVKFYTISSTNKWSITAPFKRHFPFACSKLDVTFLQVRVEGEWFRVTDFLDHLYSEAEWTRHKYRLYQRETWVYDIDPPHEMLKAQRNWWGSNGKHFRFIELPIEIQKRVCKVGLGMDYGFFMEIILHGASKVKGVD